MQIAGLQKFSLIDFPGQTSAVLFTRGCGFRCDFCHNPELVDPQQYADLIPTEEILDFLRSRRGQLDGVAITGGDPTIQTDLIPFLQAVKDLGFAIKLDTIGSLPNILREIARLKLVDYLAMDVKGPLARYQQLTHSKIDTAKILESIGLIMNSGIDYEFRTTVVKGMLKVEDLVAVGREMIRGAQRYFLQKFIPSKTLNPAYMSKVTLSEAEFSQARSQLLAYVQACEVR